MKRAAGRTAARPKKNIAPLHPTLEPPDVESFAEFDLGDDIQAVIAGMGITTPTPIQALAIDPVLAGKDVIAKAETGTGKTLAFGAPMMSKIDPDRSTVLGLVLSPTRELAEQVHDVLEQLGKARGVSTALIVGGEQMGPQVRALQAGAQVVVGTPGRVLDLLNQRFLQFPWTEFAVLDEADKMLEIGFIDDVKKILDACNEHRQTLLFSATFPPPLLELARGYTSDPVEIATASGVATVDSIHQYFLKCSEEDRARELSHLIEDSDPDDRFLVFCERRTDVDRLMRQLERRRFSVKALHGGYDQAARFRVMGAFRTGDVKALVATDVASRGLDVVHVTHVVNLGVPRDVSDYTHRIGRTGRAGRDGVAVTFVSRRDERDWKNLERQSGFDLTEIERPRDLFAIERRRRAQPDDTPEREDAAEGRDDRDVDERPRRRRRRREREDRRPRDEADDRPRRPRKSESRPESKSESKSESESKSKPESRSKSESKPGSKPEPATRRKSKEGPSPSAAGGFGSGLTEPEPDPRRNGDGDTGEGRRGRRRRRGESSAKERSERPKRNAERNDERSDDRPRRAERPSRSSGFGAGI